MNVSCQCGSVAFTTGSASAPRKVYICHCTECRKQSSSAFGISAKFPAAAVPFSDRAFRDATGVWSRVTKSGATLDCYFCKACGARVLHGRRDAIEARDVDPGASVNIKGGLVEGLDLRDVMHIWTQEAVVPVPDGAESYPESPPPSPA